MFSTFVYYISPPYLYSIYRSIDLYFFAGVESVEINRKEQKVTVVGYMDQYKVLKKAKSTGKKAEIWPYVHYSLVRHPYAHLVYDRKAPPGYVRNIDYATHATQVSRQEEQYYISMFSDDNPNACSIM